LRDDDRKELADAGDFAADKAAALLVPAAQWPQWLCRQPRLAVMAPGRAEARYPELASTPPVVELKLYKLWVLDRASLMQKGLSCPNQALPKPAEGG
jgi:hypothetical protein